MKKIITLIILLFALPLYAGTKLPDMDDMNGTADNTYLVWVSENDNTGNDGKLTIPQLITLGLPTGITGADTYDSGWNGENTVPRKDDIYDYLHQIDTDDDGDISDETANQRQKCIYLEYPTTEELLDPAPWEMEFAAVITRVSCNTDTGTVTLNLENSDSDLLSAELVCDDGGQTSCASDCDVDTIQDAQDNFTQYEEVGLDISATASSPTAVRICFYYIKDN